MIRGLLIILIVFPILVSAQPLTTNYSPHFQFQEALNLFEKEKYPHAQAVFITFYNEYQQKLPTLSADAEYYAAVCAVRLFNDDAEYRIRKFIENHPENYFVKAALFEITRYYYRAEKFEKALEWLNKIDKYDLEHKDRPEYYFMSGYSFFKIKNYDTARGYLFPILNSNNEYRPSANYYYAHIAYEQKNFQTAYNSISSLTNDSTFQMLVPYYICHILYKQSRYEDIVKYAPSRFDSLNEKRKPEFSRIIGDAYYHTSKYDSALKFYEYFISKTPILTDNDKYRIAYTYYLANETDSAIVYFESISSDTGLLGQNKLYHLGDCYLKTNLKKKASAAFYTASKMWNDSLIRQDALFNYAMVTYETSYSPFYDAIDAFNQYITEYPESEKVDIAFKFLVLSYLTTKNYQGALASIHKIKFKTEDVYEAYQRIAYFRSLELINDLKLDEANTMLDTALMYGDYDHSIMGESHYWKGEIAFRKANYAQAINHYRTFTTSMGSSNSVYFINGIYGLGYSFFNIKDYQNASLQFVRVTDKNIQDNKHADALNRLADCYFMNASYNLAIETYNKAASNALSDPDYSLYQKAVCYGVISKYKEKSWVLRVLLKEYPNSEYADDASYQLAETFLIINQMDSAVNRFEYFTANYPLSPLRPDALVKLGLLYYNNSKYDEALIAYKKVIQEHAGTPNEKNALIGIKNIYIEKQKIDDYYAFLKTVNKSSDLSIEEKDSIRYMVAYNAFVKQDHIGAIGLFNVYLQEFPSGAFVNDATFNKAESCRLTNDFSCAIENYTSVKRNGKSFYYADAILQLARIHYQQKNYNLAIENYELLISEPGDAKIKSECLLALMRAHFLSDNHPAYMHFARQILITEHSDQELRRESLYKIMKGNMAINSVDAALDTSLLLFDDVKSIEGSEAKYTAAYIYFTKAIYDDVKREVFEFIDMNTPHRYWLAKSFILLSDVYVKEDDVFQAKHTLKSIIENYENKEDGILNEANAKLKLLEE